MLSKGTENGLKTHKMGEKGSEKDSAGSPAPFNKAQPPTGGLGG